MEALEDERSRLMEAEAVLNCVLVAMDDDDGCNARGPYYPSVIGLARDLVNQSINQLDSVRLRPMIEQINSGAESSEKLESRSRSGREQALRGNDGVKECAPEYLH